MFRKKKGRNFYMIHCLKTKRKTDCAWKNAKHSGRNGQRSLSVSTIASVEISKPLGQKRSAENLKYTIT